MALEGLWGCFRFQKRRPRTLSQNTWGRAVLEVDCTPPQDAVA